MKRQKDSRRLAKQPQEQKLLERNRMMKEQIKDNISYMRQTHQSKVKYEVESAKQSKLEHQEMIEMNQRQE